MSSVIKLNSLIKLKNQLREFVDNDEYEIESPGGGTHPGEPFFFSILDVETEFNEISEQLAKQQNEIIEYKAFMLGLKLSSEDEARMLSMFAKYNKSE